MPVLALFAGPNGSGKSSIIRRVDYAGRDRLLEADAIATRIHGVEPRPAAIAAAREVLSRTQEYLDAGLDFAIETTLSGIWTTRVIHQAGDQAFSYARSMFASALLNRVSSAFASVWLEVATMFPTTIFGVGTVEVSQT